MKLFDPAQVLKEADAQGLRRVLIVTALPLEMEAIRAHLADLGTIKGRDDNFLELGHFSGQGDDWLAVVVESGAGTHEAHSAVASALVTIGDVELIVFVGVAASRKPLDAPIGSVIAANFLYWPYAGKEGKTFSARPHTLQVKPPLVHLAKKVARDRDWSTRVRLPASFPQPGSSNYPAVFPPKALVAPIVSVEAVIANSRVQIEKRIVQHFGDAAGLEMEGYGAVFAADRENKPIIVVRGVSDLRDGKDPAQDAIDQPIAAAHASAFAFELINGFGISNPRREAVASVTSPAPPEVRSTEGLSAPGGAAGATSSTATNSAVAAAECHVVLTFAGHEADFPRERIDSIVEGLRILTGNPNISVLKTMSGSFSLLLRVHEADIEKLQGIETANFLHERFSAKVVSVLREHDFDVMRQDQKLLDAASRSLLNWPRTLPDGTEISRPEFQQLISNIGSTETSTTAVLGLPGSGKSALLAALGTALRERGIPILAIKADLLNPTVDSENKLKDFLELARPPSAIVREVSKFKPIVLIIDQLDALATYVDLSTARLNVLLNLIRSLSGERNIHIVLSARAFEYEHDARLKTIQAESVILALPAWSAVLRILEDHGVSAAGWPLDAQEVMRTPQALATFLKLDRPQSIEPFFQYHEMLNYLWRERILTQPNGSKLSALASKISEDMAERETLWLSSARYDDQAHTLASLVASGILSFGDSSGSVGFSHQTVFEHALARAFSQSTGSLSAYVLPRASSLFIRPKLWTALAYLRGVEPDTYLSELGTIWNVPTLRKHLRILLIEFLGQQISPTDAEAVFFVETLKSSYRRTALQAMIGSRGWFERLRGTVAEAMVTEGEESVAAGILNSVWSFAPENVVALINAHWLSSGKHDGIVWAVVRGCRTWSEDVLKIAEIIASRSELSPYEFEDMISVVGASQPEFAIRLVAKRLYAELRKGIIEAERRMTLTMPVGDDTARIIWRIENSTSDPITKLVESDGWDSLEALAAENPAHFLKYLWPWFRDALAALRRFVEENDGSGFALSYLLDLRFEGEKDDLDLPERSILGAFRVAVECLAAQEPAEFEIWLAANEAEDAVPAQRLFAHALASQPGRFASRSLKFFLDDLDRLDLGNSQDSTSTATRLIRSASPFWTAEELLDFKNAVLGYKPRPRTGLDPKSKQYFDQIIRKLKLRILASLPEDRTSSAVKRLIREERRRFPDDRMGVTFSGPAFVGSPIEAKSLALASDKDIINAFRQLPDAVGWDNPRHWGRGGNVQLAREFGEFAKGNPHRAKGLIEQFDATYGTRAAAYAIDAMAESAPPELIIDLIKSTDARSFQGEEFRGSAARAIERLIRREFHVDDATLGLLTAWLSSRNTDEQTTEADDDDDLTKPSEPDSPDDKEIKRDDSVLWGMGGLSILPGGNYPIIEALIRILLQRKDPDRIVDLLDEHLKRGDDKRVWNALFRWFAYVRPTDPHKLANLISNLFKSYPNLSKTREAAMMLAHALWTMPDLVGAVMGDWRTADAPRVQQAYGELVALAALVRPELNWPKAMLSNIMSNGGEDARVGVAYAATNVWADNGARSAAAEASKLLQQLMPTATPKIWHAVLDLFRVMDEIRPDDNWVPLLTVLADQIRVVGRQDAVFLVERLQTLLPHQASLIGKIAIGLVENWRIDLADLRTGTSSVAPDLVDIAVTLHRLGPDTREIGTTLFEELLEANAYSARATLDQIDNRFRSSAASQVRRLPRRTRRTRRAVRQIQG